MPISSFKQESSRRLLIVDDDPIFGELALEAARRLGIWACLTTNEVSAIACASTLAIDVAVIDCDLGKTLGLDLARALPALPAVLVSRSARHLRCAGATLPTNVRASLLKGLGVATLLRCAYDISLIERWG